MRPSRSPRLLACVAVALCGGLLWAGCGGDDDEGDGEGTAAEETTATEASGPTEVTVTAEEYSFELSETPSAPGDATFILDNVGQEPHVLLAARINEGFTLDEAFELQGRQGSAEELGESFARPGQQGKPLEIELTPGDYALICPIGANGKSHFELGQRAEFTIEG
jgi:hypothetical protein